MFLAIAALSMSGCRELEEQGDNNQETPKEDVYIPSESPDPFSWVAIDGQGNTIDPDLGVYPEKSGRDGKIVAVFYFLWHGCHGYDSPYNSNDVMLPTASDTRSPFDIQKLLDENPVNPALGDIGVMHHWGEPYLGYYVSNDAWVIRKHAQMLVDAGVDAIFFDVTNGYHYNSVFRRLALIFSEMRANGNKTPQFAFLLNANVGALSQGLYDEIYSTGKFKDLWFTWDGKPVMLAKQSEVPADIRDFFTLRQSWFLSNNANSDKWFGNGDDKWPWGSVYPQKAGKHAGKNEFVPVMPATHPISNIGRSFDVTTGTEPANPTPEKGIYFKKQFERAMSLDPQIIFFTGWNEWTAQRQRPSDSPPPYFVDQYNHEFSRDIEPLNGGFGDNYYYMMADFIRKFKGARKIPVFNERKDICIDGSFEDWSGVNAKWGDDSGDISHRNHFGWGRIGDYFNDTGRNDIVLSAVVNDSNNLYFYVRTSSDITSCTDPQWMQLFIRVDGTKENWEGFDFAINRTSGKDGYAVLEKCLGGWRWTKVGDVSYRLNGNEMEMAIPLSSLGIKNPKEFTIDFKWIDNAALNGDIQTCMRDGDSAPNGRFRYRYKFKE